MRIVNEDTGTELARDAGEATTAWARFRGLMLRHELPEGSGLVIRPCSSIHMMFMRFPIDVVFFDGDGVVTKVAPRVPRWRGVAFGGRGAKGVIELPAGAAEGTAKGHQLRFER